MCFDINEFSAKIICESEITDATIETEKRDNELDLYITASNDKPKFIELRWNAPADENLKVLGDVWERSYGDLEFRKLTDNDRCMP